MFDEEERPNPEELLKAIRGEEIKRKKGRLKIFLGMSAGVGKTFSMLKEAQKLKSVGIDLVVGNVNTHGRLETQELVNGLTLIPEKYIEYKDSFFKEMDLDAILKRKPQLVIVDELAHTNIPGSRHFKRWQDVMEILDNGIDVFTTLNVQHIESLKDVVESITAIPIRETVPDIVIERATFIVLVDVTISELLQRLKEGKVYLGEQSELAARNFFQEDRLTALREMVLRYAAEKVDHDLHGLVSTIERADKWRPREKLLVAVSESSHSQKLIRTAKRLSFTLDAPWIAIHVDDGRTIPPEAKETLRKNLALAHELGAEVISTHDESIAVALIRVARQRGITQIIIGRAPRRHFRDFFSRFSLLDKLASECSDIDIHVIRQVVQVPTYKRKWQFNMGIKKLLAGLIPACFTAGVAAMCSLAGAALDYRVVGFILLSAVLFMSLFFKKGPLIFTALVSAAIWDFFFIPPVGDLAIFSTEDSALLALFLATAFFTAIIADRSRKNRELLTKRQEATIALYDVVRDIASAPSKEQVLEAVKQKLSFILEGKVEIILARFENGLQLDPPQEMVREEKEQAAAMWVFENGKEAGWSTSTLPSAKNLYLPLKGASHITGVLIYQPKTKNELSIEEKNFLFTICQQLAYYLERSFLEEKQRKVAHLSHIEKIYQTVLNLVSNQFQSPLKTIRSAMDDLKEAKLLEKDKVSAVSLYCIDSSTKEMLRVIENASAMAQLSTGQLPLNKERNSIRELVMSCYDNAKKVANEHRIVVQIQENIPLFEFDFVLIEILVSNLLTNAVLYSPPASTIELEAKQYDGTLVVSVADEGKGIPTDMLDTIFEKFYRLPGTSTLGLGLGLSIAKAIAEMHGGKLKAENRKTGGTKFSLYLPIEL